MTGLGRFVVENGMLKTEGGMGLLYYHSQQFGNQTIRVVYKTSGDRGNSGVYIRMPEPPPDQWYGVHNGYEVQIDGKGDEWHRSGAVYSISKSTRNAQKPDGEWNTMEIELAGPVTRVRLNGELVNEYKDGAPVPERKYHYEPVRGPRPDAGYIGLQNHDPDSKVYFKEVSVIGGKVNPPTPSPILSKEDRDILQSNLHSSRKQIIDLASSLTDEQLTYKPAPDRWSVRDIIEHLVLTEEGIFAFATSGLQKSAAKPAQKMADEAFMNVIRDRSKKAEAPEVFRPTGKWATKQALINEFKARRDKNLMWVTKTSDDLRNNYIQLPYGTFDVYQGLLLLPAHNERHLAQAKEVMASPGFPKK